MNVSVSLKVSPIKSMSMNVSMSLIVNLKVRPHYAARHTAAKCGKAAQQKLRHATSICGRCVGLAAACHSMRAV